MKDLTYILIIIGLSAGLYAESSNSDYYEKEMYHYRDAYLKAKNCLISLDISDRLLKGMESGELTRNLGVCEMFPKMEICECGEYFND